MKRNTMKLIPAFIFPLLLLSGIKLTGQVKTYDIFSYQVPKGFSLQKLDAALFYSKKDSKSYCQLFLYPAVTSQGSPEADFDANWNSFARNSQQGVNEPDTKETDTANGWHIIMGAARGRYANKPYVISLTTLSNGSIRFYTAAVFTDQKYMKQIQDFTGSILPDLGLFARNKSTPLDPGTIVNQATNSSGNTGITKSSTKFDDGWVASPTNDCVKLTKPNIEIRLHYINDKLDNARPNTVDATDYYWNQYVSPYFNITQKEKWSGVEYPVIYFMQGSGTDRSTGKPCHVALKIVYSNGARPIVVISPDQRQYLQQYPHPNDVDRMLNYNKFALSPADITGKWTGGSGAGLQYYNAYTGEYAGMSAISTSDDFQFNTDGTYTSAYRAANSNSGNTRFSAIDYKGKFTCTDWTISAGNRYQGKTTLFRAQLIAVRNGYLLYMEDSENPSMNYTLIKVK
jgi:hypothetical protein